MLLTEDRLCSEGVLGDEACRASTASTRGSKISYASLGRPV